MITYYAYILRLSKENEESLTQEEVLQKAENAVKDSFGENTPSVYTIRLYEDEKQYQKLHPSVLSYRGRETGDLGILIRGAERWYYPIGKKEEDLLSSRINHAIKNMKNNGLKFDTKLYGFLSPDGFEGQKRTSCIQAQTEHVRLFNVYSLYAIDHPHPISSLTKESEFVSAATGKIYPALVSYYSRVTPSQTTRPTVTIAFNEQESGLNALEIAQALFGDGAGGSERIAWSPSDVQYTQEKIREMVDLIEKLEQLKQMEHEIQNVPPHGKDAIKNFIQLNSETQKIGKTLYNQYPGISFLKKYQPAKSQDINSSLDTRP